MDNLNDISRPSSSNGAPRPATGSTLERAEEIALAFAIERGNQDLPPPIAKLIQFSPESFSNKSLGKIALVVRSMTEQRQAVHFRSVEAKCGEPLLMAQLENSVLMREQSELEAEAALAAYQVRRAISISEETSKALVGSPGKAGIIIDGAIRSYTELNADQGKGGLTIRTPDEILAMSFDDGDRILGDHLLDDGGNLALLGAGGVGKSRLLLLLLACIAGARRFLTFDTFRPNMKWLVLQTENSNRRLQQDIAPLKSWLGDNWPRFTERVIIHTIETDADGFMNLDDTDAVARIQAAIQENRPDGIIIDPLNDFAIGDLNKDSDMKLTLQTLSRICRRGNPKRVIIVSHHSLTGRAGAAKATGYDRAGFARNSKVIHAWTRGQINIAPVDPDNNDRLIIACGKCSNGREFQTFAVRLNRDSMIYECDPTVDVTQWQQDMTGAKDNAPLMNPDRVRELCDLGGSNKAALAKAIMDDCGCYRGSAYRYITRAEQATKISFKKSNETYYRK
ncbi:MAG TPA: AAA family ATPase [Candidatus Limnocylindrales bacterium]|nr:AAA family ATPase [Candidatus Limnocylindrales bacterium]